MSPAELEGLRLPRDRAPGGLEVAAGEYACLRPDRSRAGHGLELERESAAPYAA